MGWSAIVLSCAPWGVCVWSVKLCRVEQHTIKTFHKAQHGLVRNRVVLRAMGRVCVECGAVQS